MKSPKYVYNTVSAYRKAIDAAEEGAVFKDHGKEVIRLKSEFNRGYTTGYLDDDISADMVTEFAPGNRGIEAGVVSGQNKDKTHDEGAGLLDFGSGKKYLHIKGYGSKDINRCFFVCQAGQKCGINYS